MEEVTTVGIDLAKNVFSLHGVDEAGKTVLRRTVRRERLVETVAALSPCLIGMEACSGAHEWGRRFQQHGHTVKLMAPKFVAPYRKSDKNDGNDAEAVCEAVSRPSMRFVPVKSTEQQALLAVHRVRQGFVVERTALINRLRGLMSEFGVVLALGSVTVRRQAAQAAEQLPELARGAIGDLLEQLRVLDERIAKYDKQIEAQAGLSEPAMRRLDRPGARSAFHRWQIAPWPHQQARRRLPSKPVGPRRPLGAAGRRRASRPHLALGARAAAAPRLLPCPGRHRQQERPHRMGLASQARERAPRSTKHPLTAS